MFEGILIKKDIERKLHNLALGKYPFECCAILLGRQGEDRIDEILPVNNASETTKRKVQFEIDPLEVYKAEGEAEKKGLEILGFFHSHPDHRASLSGMDEEYMIPGMIYIIASVDSESVPETRGYTKNYTDGSAEEIIIRRE